MGDDEVARRDLVPGAGQAAGDWAVYVPGPFPSPFGTVMPDVGSGATLVL